jgi:hypothetical protein
VNDDQLAIVDRRFVIDAVSEESRTSHQEVLDKTPIKVDTLDSMDK